MLYSEEDVGVQCGLFYLYGRASEDAAACMRVKKNRTSAKASGCIFMSCL